MVRTRGRMIALLSALVTALTLYAVPRIVESIPREPRLVFRNVGSSDIAPLVVESPDGKIDLGRVRAGESIVLPVAPRAGTIYSIRGNEFTGDELLRYLRYARESRTDVRLTIDEDGSGWLEDEGPRNSDGFPVKRRIGNRFGDGREVVP